MTPLRASVSCRLRWRYYTGMTSNLSAHSLVDACIHCKWRCHFMKLLRKYECECEYGRVKFRSWTLCCLELYWASRFSKVRKSRRVNETSQMRLWAPVSPASFSRNGVLNMTVVECFFNRVTESGALSTKKSERLLNVTRRKSALVCEFCNN